MGNTRINAFTWNVANRTVSREMFSYLCDYLLKFDPDILILGFQELGFLTDINGLSSNPMLLNRGYSVIHSASITTLTKPTEPGKVLLLILAKTPMVCRYEQGYYKDKNKGGLAVRLKVNTIFLDVFACHLDAKSDTKRQLQFKMLLHSLPSNQEAVHTIVLGDFNERLTIPILNKHSSDVPIGYDLKDRDSINNLIQKYDPLSTNKTYLYNEHEIVFQKLKNITYHQPGITNNSARLKKGRDRPDIGCLDNVGVKSDKLIILDHDVLDITDSDMTFFSDHKAVIKNLLYPSDNLELRIPDSKHLKQPLNSTGSGEQKRHAVYMDGFLAQNSYDTGYPNTNVVDLVKFINSLSYCFESIEDFKYHLRDNREIEVPSGYPLLRTLSGYKYEIIHSKTKKPIYRRDFYGLEPVHKFIKGDISS